MNEQDLEIINRYKNDLDWMLYELSSRYIGKRTFTYNNSIGKITIEVNG